MPTNLPDPRKQKVQVSEERFLSIMVAFIVVGMVIACAIIANALAS
jgi:hypothetical protein